MRARFLVFTGMALPILAAADLFAQTSPSPASSAAVSAKPAVSTTPLPSPSASDLLNSLTAADLQQAIPLLKNNFVNPEATSEPELTRATMYGLVSRYRQAVMVLADKNSGPAETTAAFYNEILEGHIGYVRIGSLSSGNLEALDKALRDFSSKKVDALIVDLRATSFTNDYATAAEFAKRFGQKGKTLFTLRKPASRQDRAFNSDREPAYHGTLVVLADGDTAGPAEALAGAIRFFGKGLVIGQSTAGRAVEYSDLALPSGKILRIAAAQAVLPDDKMLFPAGVNPDLPVPMSPADKMEIFKQSAQKGLSEFIYERSRPHLNEAALIAGTNPELEAAEAAQKRARTGEKLPPRDVVLQRALDVVTSLSIYQKR